MSDDRRPDHRPPLTYIGDIDLPNLGLATPVQVARNGDFKLIQQAGVDVYNTPYFQEVELPDGIGDYSRDIIHDLVQVIGRLMVERQGRDDVRRAKLEQGG